MNNKKNENKFLRIWCLVVVIFVMIGFFNFSFKSTMGYFEGGMTGSLSAFDVYYFSNYPDGFTDLESIKDNQKSNYYKINDNIFEVPDGYEFVAWNTFSDGSGKNYVLDDVVKLTEQLNLYAQWRLVEVIEPGDSEKKSYGDVNLDGEISSDDYLMIENYLNGSSDLSDESLINADVNVDGNVDLVDVDIIKQVCLGNNRYVGYLPNSPILIYDIYEGSIDVGNGGNTDDSGDKENIGDGGIDNGDNITDGNGAGSGSGSSQGGGTSSEGSGNSTSGGNSGNNSSNNKGNGSSGNKVDNDDKKNESVDKEDNVEEKTLVYKFKFMNDGKEYANTECMVINDKNCELVLPDSPKKNGYKFNGWSINENCISGDKIKAPIIVDSGNTYYACYIMLDMDNSNRTSYVGIIVFSICLLTVRLIWHLIYKFKKKNDNIDDEK